MANRSTLVWCDGLLTWLRCGLALPLSYKPGRYYRRDCLTDVNLAILPSCSSTLATRRSLSRC